MRTLETSVKWIRVLIIATPFSRGLIEGLVRRKCIESCKYSKHHECIISIKLVGLSNWIDLVETKLFSNNKKKKNVPIYTGEFFFPQWDTRYFIYIPKCLIGIKNVSNLHARATSFTFQNSFKMYRELVEYLTICTIIVVLFFVDVFFFFYTYPKI